MKQKLLHKEAGPSSPKPNLTGIPIQTKLELEARSGLSFDDIRVHYRSPEPARLGARAFTDGRDVYLAPREEGQLPHELGHVIQRRVRTVLPTRRVAGVPVNDSPALEREADQFAAGGSLPGPSAGSPSLGCVQRMSLRNEETGLLEGGEIGSWEELTQKLPARQKVLVRKTLMTCAGPCSEVSGLWSLDEDDLARRPEDAKAFYEAVTPHMEDQLYWINYVSYATGDLSSLAASVVSDLRHGIYMYWSEIGESDPAKNAELLRQFLGGVIDWDAAAQEYYIVTDNGAKGRCPVKAAPQSKSKDYGGIQSSEEPLAVDLQEAAFHYLSCGKLWKQVADMLGIFPELSEAAGETAQCYSAAMRALSAALDEPDMLMAPGRSPLLNLLDLAAAAERTWQDRFRAWLDANFQPYMESPPLRSFDQIAFGQNPDSPMEPTARFDSVMNMDQPAPLYPDGPSLRILAEAIRRHDRAGAALLVGSGMLKWFAMETLNYDFAKPHDVHHLQTRQVDRLKLSAGTQLVAIGWDREKRDKVRRAWGVGEGEGPAASYDAALETWLQARGIDPKTAVYGKKVVVLWIRKSGERGGAHFENDTSFKGLAHRAKDYLDASWTVFLTGDEKDQKAAGIPAACGGRPIYNVTQFWREDSDALKAWGGNTRTGQFRLYDYLKRRAATLLHVGAMSGNLEAMSLLGHSVEVHVNSPYDSGVSRMQAYDVHDLGLQGEGEPDMLSYRLTYVPYGKKAAAFYVTLSQRTRMIRKQFKVGDFSELMKNKTFGSFAESLSGTLGALREEREALLRQNPPPGEGALSRLSAEISEKEELEPVLRNCRPRRSLNLYNKDLRRILLQGLAAGKPFDELREALGIAPAAGGGPPAGREQSPPSPEEAAYSQALSHIYAQMNRNSQAVVEKIVASYSDILGYELDTAPSTDKLLGQYVTRIFIQAAQELSRRFRRSPWVPAEEPPAAE